MKSNYWWEKWNSFQLLKIIYDDNLLNFFISFPCDAWPDVFSLLFFWFYWPWQPFYLSLIEDPPFSYVGPFYLLPLTLMIFITPSYSPTRDYILFVLFLSQHSLFLLVDLLDLFEFDSIVNSILLENDWGLLCCLSHFLLGFLPLSDFVLHNLEDIEF